MMRSRSTRAMASSRAAASFTLTCGWYCCAEPSEADLRRELALDEGWGAMGQRMFERCCVEHGTTRPKRCFEASVAKHGLFETASAPAGICKLVWRRSYNPQRVLGVKFAAGARGSCPLLSTLAASAACIFEVEDLRPRSSCPHTSAVSGSGLGATWKAARSAANTASAAAMTRSSWPRAASKRRWPRAPGLKTNSASSRRNRSRPGAFSATPKAPLRMAAPSR